MRSVVEGQSDASVRIVEEPDGETSQMYPGNSFPDEFSNERGTSVDEVFAGAQVVQMDANGSGFGQERDSVANWMRIGN